MRQHITTAGLSEGRTWQLLLVAKGGDPYATTQPHDWPQRGAHVTVTASY